MKCWRHKKIRKIFRLEQQSDASEAVALEENCNQLQNRRPNNDGASKRKDTTKQRHRATTKQKQITDNKLGRRSVRRRNWPQRWRRWHFVEAHQLTFCYIIFLFSFSAAALQRIYTASQHRIRVLVGVWRKRIFGTFIPAAAVTFQGSCLAYPF